MGYIRRQNLVTTLCVGMHHGRSASEYLSLPGASLVMFVVVFRAFSYICAKLELGLVNFVVFTAE